MKTLPIALAALFFAAAIPSAHAASTPNPAPTSQDIPQEEGDSFAVTFQGSPADLVRKAQTLADHAGASFKGNETAGKFSTRSVAGVYHVRGNLVTITITDRPFLVPWSLIESKVRRFFA
jgi:hypothetical protein